MKYEFTKELATNNSVIDNQHIELLSKINDFSNACMSGTGRDNVKSTLDFLLDYTEFHFKTEENLQTTHSYPLFSEHKQIHKTLKDKFFALRNELNKTGADIKMVASFNMLVSELITHIKIQDKKMALYINEHSK